MAFPQFAYRNYARFSEPVLARDPQQPPEWQILLRLAAIVQGQGAQVDVQKLDDALFSDEVRRTMGEHADAVLRALSHLSGPERQIDLALRTGPYGDRFGQKPDGINLEKVKATPGGIDLGPLQPRIPEMLRTASGQIELAPPMLVADLVRVNAALAQQVPDLVIVGRRQVRSGNSWMHNLPTLAKGPFRCTALIHPHDAQRYGLRDGSHARITNGGRKIVAQIELSEDMMPGVVSLPHGWGHNLAGTRMAVAAERPGANLNALLDETRRDPLSGNAVLAGIAVTIEPID
jgi:anaerobic selenocysteine-containing dehydrogenase